MKNIKTNTIKNNNNHNKMLRDRRYKDLDNKYF